VLAQGKYEELVEKGIDFVSLMTSDSVDDVAKKGSVVKVEEVCGLSCWAF
jgi:hypothetical protein